jgi:hypothetical protein
MLVRDALHARRIDAGAPEIVLQANPGRRDLRDGGELHLKEVSKAEVRPRPRPHHEEWITGDDITEADKIRTGIGIARHHHAQRAAPHHVDFASPQRLARRYRVGRGPELDLHACSAERPGGMRGIERRIEQGAKILGQDNRHGRSPRWQPTSAGSARSKIVARQQCKHLRAPIAGIWHSQVA